VNTQEYLQIWSKASTEVLQQALGTPFQVEVDPKSDAAPLADEGVWLEFAASEPISAQQAFWISPSDATFLAQAFMGETADPLAPFTSDHADAVAELFRQVAGAAALAFKPSLGKEFELRFITAATPAWTPVTRARFRVVPEGHPPLAVHVQLDSALTSSQPPAALERSPLAQQAQFNSGPSILQPPMAPSAIPSPAAPALFAAPAPPASEPRNLNLLLDMELEVAIRFGKREMQLRDILELNSGSVIEFEQQIEEPVELLLGGRLIGHGEVVVVDGNYGLRLTEISTTQARLNSLMQ
jgi:flagellar motor switch protein FliN/FliY